SGDGDRAALGNDRGDLRPMPGDARSVVRRGQRVEAFVRCSDRGHMRLVQRSHGLDGSVELWAGTPLRLRETPADHVESFQRMAQAEQVELAQLVELRPDESLGVGV